jgi:hypothetical protein
MITVSVIVMTERFLPDDTRYPLEDFLIPLVDF